LTRFIQLPNWGIVLPNPFDFHLAGELSSLRVKALLEVSERSQSTRDGLLCVLVFAVCFFAAWPFAEIGCFNDDWSYIKSAQTFSETHHLVYYGWDDPMLGWLIPWGALFVRLFGFSFTAVKLSTLPIAAATIFLFHAILVRFGCTSRNAVIGALTLGLSPLFMPLAASYMTDVAGLFVLLLCLYCCKRAVDAHSDTATIGWLCLAGATNVAGGTVRQIIWLGALVMVPSTAWLLRKRRGVLAAAAMLWACTTAAIFCCMHWYESQPYSAPQILSIQPPYERGLILGCFGVVSEMLCLLLLVYPVLVPWLGRLRNLGRGKIAVLAAVLVLWTVVQSGLNWILPWVQSPVFAPITNGQIGPRFAFPVPFRLLLSALLVATVIVLSLTARTMARGEAGETSKSMFWLFAPFSLCYFALIFPRATIALDIDRYVFCLMPIAIVLLIRLHQEGGLSDLPAISIAVLAFYALFSIANTHDWFAWQRARLAAINEVRASGVPRNEIQGGYEYDGWTQIGNGGHINDPRIRIPAGAYKPNPRLPHVANDCKFFFSPYTPDVRPVYTVAFEPKPCFLPSQFPPAQYFAWLPPFRRAVYIQRFPAQ
jgi:hypothetical protein